MYLPHISFWKYSALVWHEATHDFHFGRDVGIATFIAVGTLAIQVSEHLIPTTDWQSHKWAWVLSILAPYAAVLGGHVIWRIKRAPWKLHQEQGVAHAQREAELSAMVSAAQRELAAERDKHGGPNVLLVWDRTDDAKKLTATKKTLIAKNTSEEDAYWVSVEDVVLENNTVKCQPIQHIAPRGEAEVKMTVEGEVGPVYAHDWNVFFHQNDSIWEESPRNKQGEFVGLPKAKLIFAVVYKGQSVIRWRSKQQFIFDTYNDRATTDVLERVRLD